MGSEVMIEVLSYISQPPIVAASRNHPLLNSVAALTD